jgi:hypothetical protein
MESPERIAWVGAMVVAIALLRVERSAISYQEIADG